MTIGSQVAKNLNNMGYVKPQKAEIIYGNPGGHNLWDNLLTLKEVSQTTMKLLQENYKGNANLMHKSNASLMRSMEELKQSLEEQKQSLEELKQSLEELRQSFKENKDMLKVVGGVGCAIWLRFVRNYERRKINYHGIHKGNVAAHKRDFPADTLLFLQIPASITSQDKDAYKSLYGMNPEEGLELCC